jgi:hypothetical protein
MILWTVEFKSDERNGVPVEAPMEEEKSDLKEDIAHAKYICKQGAQRS